MLLDDDSRNNNTWMCNAFNMRSLIRSSCTKMPGRTFEVACMALQVTGSASRRDVRERQKRMWIIYTDFQFEMYSESGSPDALFSEGGNSVGPGEKSLLIIIIIDGSDVMSE